LDTYVEVNTNLSEFDEVNTLETYRVIMRVRQRLYATSTEVAKQFGLHSSEMALLDTLGKYGPLTMGQLAERSFSSAANATYTIQGLEQHGLVKRSRSKDSHRVVNVKLTAAGEKMFRKTYVQTVQNVNAMIGEQLGKNDRNTLLDLLNKMVTPESD
jgi:DNA-binding MarR family transcriptional regulator